MPGAQGSRLRNEVTSSLNWALGAVLPQGSDKPPHMGCCQSACCVPVIRAAVPVSDERFWENPPEAYETGNVGSLGRPLWRLSI